MKALVITLSLLATLLMASLAMASEVAMQIVTAPFGPMAQFGAGWIYVPCTFDSHSESCLIDTGSDTSNIQDDSFSQSYPVIDTTTGEGLSGDPVSCDIIQVGAFGLGDAIMDDQRLVRCSQSSTQPSSAADGNIAGLSSFFAKTIHFDFSKNTFSLTDSIPAEFKKRPLVIHQKLGHFGFPATISGVNADSIVDTGAALTTVDKNFIQANPSAFTFIQAVSGGQDVNGDPVAMNLYEVKSLSFGNITLANVYVLGADFTAIQKFLPGVPVILGFNVVSQKNWYFDLGQKLWAVY